MSARAARFLHFVVEDGGAVGVHELNHEVEVVDGGEGEGGDLAGFEEMVQVGHAEARAGRALAIGYGWSKVFSTFGFGDIEATVWCEEQAVPCCACGIGAIEGVDAKWNTELKGCEISNAKQVNWLVSWEMRQGS